MDTTRDHEPAKTASYDLPAGAGTPRPRTRIIVDLSDLLAEVFATVDEHSSAENARRLAHVLLTGELPRDFEWRRRAG